MTTNQRGYSLIESLLVIVVISSIVFLLASIPNALGLINKSEHLSIAREIAAKQIEDKRVINYKDLTNGKSAILDFRLNLLPQGKGEILIEDCDLKICINNEKIKQVTVLVNWKDWGKLQSVNLRTMISKRSLK